MDLMLVSIVIWSRGCECPSFISFIFDSFDSSAAHHRTVAKFTCCLFLLHHPLIYYVFLLFHGISSLLLWIYLGNFSFVSPLRVKLTLSDSDSPPPTSGLQRGILPRSLCWLYFFLYIFSSCKS